jgi:hypothetical protein
MDINEFFADETPSQPNPRRGQRNYKKEQLRTYGILAAVAVLILLFILFAAGSIKRSNAKREAARQESIAVMESSLAEKAAWDKEAEILLAEASAVAAGYVIFEKFIKGKLCCCKKNDDSVEAFDLSDECCECCDCEIAEEVVEEIAAEDAE